MSFMIFCVIIVVFILSGAFYVYTAFDDKIPTDFATIFLIPIWVVDDGRSSAFAKSSDGIM